MVSLALFQPDIAQNVGAVMRLCAAFGMRLHVIEPCGFVWNRQKIRKSAMDYIDHVDLKRHTGWQDFYATPDRGRIILTTTKSATSYTDMTYRADDILLMGRESAGVPEDIHEACDLRVRIPMRADMRSLNIANAAAIVVSEALRQCPLPDLA